MAAVASCCWFVGGFLVTCVIFTPQGQWEHAAEALSASDCCPFCHLRLAYVHAGEEKKPQPVALGSAVKDGIIANETLAYFIGRTWLFFCRAGVDPKRMRFRQHLQHEVRALYRFRLLCIWRDLDVAWKPNRLDLLKRD